MRRTASCTEEMHAQLGSVMAAYLWAAHGVLKLMPSLILPDIGLGMCQPPLQIALHDRNQFRHWQTAV